MYQPSSFSALFKVFIYKLKLRWNRVKLQKYMSQYFNKQRTVDQTFRIEYPSSRELILDECGKKQVDDSILSCHTPVPKTDKTFIAEDK